MKQARDKLLNQHTERKMDTNATTQEKTTLRMRKLLIDCVFGRLVKMLVQILPTPHPNNFLLNVVRVK